MVCKIRGTVSGNEYLDEKNGHGQESAKMDHHTSTCQEWGLELKLSILLEHERTSPKLQDLMSYPTGRHRKLILKMLVGVGLCFLFLCLMILSHVNGNDLQSPEVFVLWWDIWGRPYPSGYQDHGIPGSITKSPLTHPLLMLMKLTSIYHLPNMVPSKIWAHNLG